ncbi:MAG: ribonuclease H-like domain-containing protein [Anaerolineaceae bacterium]|nr:MAG: ribonuclease H-like domain-containing protein [Anaerolineaceae bacterium]
MGDEALRRRLGRLDRKRRRQKSKVDSEPAPPGRGLPPGEEIDTPFGPAFLIQNQYPMDYKHGRNRLADILEFDTSIAAEVARQPSLGETSIERLVFIDTETTGLVGGAGTIAFMIGIGVFRDDAFVLRQYFLRDPGEERGMLTALQGDLESAEGFVSYNGRAFDLPLLEMRYMLGLRHQWSLSTWPQFDLLHPARRLWRMSLPDCTLGTIEKMQLDVHRTEEDVPGSLIPGLYLDYLRSGDASQMARIVYHNEVDILTLVGLATQILNRHQYQDSSELSGSEALAVARWHQEVGRLDAAEDAFLRAIKSSKPDVRVDALHRYTAYLKSQDRRDEAIEKWQTLHSLSPDDPRPCIELSKYFEWHANDLAQAQQWAQEALVCLSHWEDGWRRDQVWGEIEHRLGRLARKAGDG